MFVQVYLITELLTGGELLDAVLERGNYSEADAFVCFKQLVEGVAYLHSKYSDAWSLTLDLNRESDAVGVLFIETSSSKTYSSLRQMTSRT